MSPGVKLDYESSFTVPLCPVKDQKIVKGLMRMACGERQRELGLLSLGKRTLEGVLPMSVTRVVENSKEDGPDFS